MRTGDFDGQETLLLCGLGCDPVGSPRAYFSGGQDGVSTRTGGTTWWGDRMHNGLHQGSLCRTSRFLPSRFRVVGEPRSRNEFL